MKVMPPRIAIPMPHSSDREYGERAIPQYERAVELAGGEPVRIPLDQAPAEVRKLAERCDGVLLPGSKADIDPARFRAPRSPHTAAADARREAVDALLLEEAYKRRKPVLAICYGLQSLNVERGGSLIQHIADFLPEEKRGKVNHQAGRKVAVAHKVEVEANSRLAQIVCDAGASGAKAPRHDEPAIAALKALRHSKADPLKEEHQESKHQESPAKSGSRKPGARSRLVVPVNSSHHQSADAVGEGLRVVACCPDDGIIEALEGISPGHFVLAVQWHPERSVDEAPASRAIFRALVEAARATD
jgi:putative glutamine amidotransferase